MDPIARHEKDDHLTFQRDEVLDQELPRTERRADSRDIGTSGA